MVEGHTTNIFCDNVSVIISSSNTKSVLNKKHSLVAYHFSCDVAIVFCMNGEYNLAETLIKYLSGTQ